MDQSRFACFKRSNLVACLLAAGLSLASHSARADMTPILPENWLVTGIRQDSGGNVAITGGTGPVSLATNSPAYIYYGQLGAIPSDPNALSLHTFHAFSNTNNGTQFYGPNTPLYNSNIAAGSISAAGAYRQAGATYQRGTLYVGALDGSGAWTQIDAPGNGTSTVGDTIPHSTMGNLVVGNFDYVSHETEGRGFIYDISGNSYKTVQFGIYSTSIFGVWQNGNTSSNHYTMVGGFSDVAGGGNAFIVNYNATASTGFEFSDFKPFTLNDNPSLITHFNGITEVDGGFTVAANSATDAAAALAFIPQNLDGSFGDATWYDIVNNLAPGVTPTADTVLGYNVLGIYTENGDTSSYLSSVPEPSTYALLAIGAAGFAFLRARRKS